MKKKFVFCILFFCLFLLFFCYNSSYQKSLDKNVKVINYNGNNLRVSIDGDVVDALPDTGSYYLVDYDCSSQYTTLTWNTENHTLDVFNGNNKGGVSCNLKFESNPLLNTMKVGSYVSYTGNNGCDGESCNGQNANYESDAKMGFCYDSKYQFISNGWRIAYIKDNEVYLVSGGAVDCMCTNNDLTTSNSSCTSWSKNENREGHINNLNNNALKYCNINYVANGVCNTSTVWNFSGDDFKNIVGRELSSSVCFTSYSDKLCGYGNDLIDNGGFYWISTFYDEFSLSTFFWTCTGRVVYNNFPSALRGVRPVIRLDSNVLVTGGSGTYEEPYTIGNNTILINDYINTKENVELKLNGSDNVKKMCISVDTSECTDYIDYSNITYLDLSDKDDGEVTIYVFYKNNIGDIIASMNKKVIIDTVAPTDSSISIGNEKGYNRTLTLNSVGADYMCFSNDSDDISNCSKWVDYDITYPWRLSNGTGEKVVYAFFKDKANNSVMVSDTITFSVDDFAIGEEYGIDYTGGVVVSSDLGINFVAGTYSLEVWGAQGGYTGGKGGYSTGDIVLTGNETLYFYVGGFGGMILGGFNGGGKTGLGAGGGGGATDIRVDTDSLYARVIVAGGGGGRGEDNICAVGGVGGGTSGGGSASQSSCGTQAGGGTQTAGGSPGLYNGVSGANSGTFGIGGAASDSTSDGGGGGGGWYGGGAGTSSSWSNGGGGGSGFVFTSSSSLPDGYLVDTSYYLSNASTIDGSKSTIPTIDGSSTETGHSGNGYIKITRLS